MPEVDQFQDDRLQRARIRQVVAILGLGGQGDGAADLPADEEGDHERAEVPVLVEMLVIEEPSLRGSQVLIHARLAMPDGPTGRGGVQGQTLAGLQLPFPLGFRVRLAFSRRPDDFDGARHGIVGADPGAIEWQHGLRFVEQRGHLRLHFGGGVGRGDGLGFDARRFGNVNRLLGHVGALEQDAAVEQPRALQGRRDLVAGRLQNRLLFLGIGAAFFPADDEHAVGLLSVAKGNGEKGAGGRRNQSEPQRLARFALLAAAAVGEGGGFLGRQGPKNRLRFPLGKSPQTLKHQRAVGPFEQADQRGIGAQFIEGGGQGPLEGGLFRRADGVSCWRHRVIESNKKKSAEL